jgi:hypothetical protein
MALGTTRKAAATFVSTASQEFAAYGIGAQSFGKNEEDR